MILKTGLGVVQGHATFYWSAIVNVALSGTVFELFDVEWYQMKILKSGLEVSLGHSNRYYLKAWVRFPIPLLR